MSKRDITRDNLNEARILVVDDEPMIAYALEETLVEAGFEIAGVAGRVDQALEIIDRGDCDAAIIDANLAGVSAAPVASALLAQSIPFIVISGYSRDQQRGIFLGAPFVQKPCVPDDLIQAVRSLLVGGLVQTAGSGPL
jgi:DNA-binding response OmpR family regulator